MKIQTLFTAGLLLCCRYNIRAQGIAPAILNASGNSEVISGNVYEWSIGEMTLVHTAMATGITVTQGLLQPAPTSNGISTPLITGEELDLFPVPATAVVNIRPSFKTGGTLILTLLDETGKLLLYEEHDLHSGREMQQLNVSAYATGNYILDISYKTATTINRNAYKIQKK